MPKAQSAGSLAYRKNQAAIWDGKAPDKYLRLLPYIGGHAILEFGAAEGVLSLLMADRDPSAQIVALEQNTERHNSALALQQRWLELGKRVGGCVMHLGDIREESRLLPLVATVVAIRTIYHLGDSIPDVFEGFARAGVASIVLCGNANRERRAASGTGDPFDEYAGAKGMTRVLETAGYRIETVVREGDPIVTGRL
jgi:hypothetical protein